MLPTTGYFKDIECPYYDNSCDRPYCHFRHRKRSQERTEELEASALMCEVPTYKPTPKSQLANTKSHIPISYVPDIIIRADRNFRIPSSFSYTEKPTYKPTPLSELSKSNRTCTVEKEKDSTVSQDNESKIDTASNDCSSKENNRTLALEDDKNIDFEELSTEFDMIDEIINDYNVTENLDVINKHNVKDKEGKTENYASSSRKHKTAVSKHDKSSKHLTMQDKDSKSSKSKSKHKSDHVSRKSSSSSRDKGYRHKHEHKKEHKADKSKNTEERARHKSRSETKQDNQCSASSSKSKHRDKERSKETHKHKDEKHKDKNKKHGKISKTHKKVSEITLVQHNKYTISDETSDNDLADVAMYSGDDSDDLNDPSLEEECYRIFNEYKPEPIEKPTQTGKRSETVEEYVPTPKKRIAYDNAEQSGSKIAFIKIKSVPNAALVMANRFKVARLTQANNEQQNIVAELKQKSSKRPGSFEEHIDNKKVHRKPSISNSSSLHNIPGKSLVNDILEGKSTNHVQYKPVKPQSTSAVDDIISGKTKPRRIAPVQNVNSIQQAKARIQEIANKKSAVATLSKTPVQTPGKGTKRVAHVPDTSLADIPDVLQPENKKIPVNIRTRYLTMLADECTKLYLLKEDAFERALNEELKVLERCAAIVTYRNSAMLAINRIRKELQEREAQGLGPIMTDETINTDSDSQFKGYKFYQNIIGYILSDEELELHGYPREGLIPGKAVISTQKQMPKVNLDETQRLCCRCFKVYLVDEVGFPLYEEECLYHPLKKRTLRGDRIYLCCKSTEDTGCVTSNTHVSETEEGSLEGFQTTMQPDREDDARSYAIYALDCEMCYTTKGLELTRVTIIDADCKTVYESLVKPLNPIIDYNTRFSGITEEQMERTSTSILQVQANILHLCNSKTVLIGHSLESDMKALKIIHSCIIDTAVMFPHRLGLPHKRALRVLASEYLRKIIQNDVAGHDSAEDALTCMELVQWKVKEDLKVRGIK